MFDIPVVLLTFRRHDCITKIIDVMRPIQPRKVYLLSDGGRNESEWAEVRKCRETAEQAIDWDCELVKHYAQENVGVYGNIALGAKWVFEREKTAIFLEDDNLPEATFFEYCKELLRRYETDNRVLWICGTNYLGQYDDESRDSYFFTQHLLPCGWASWSDKFLKYYDFDLQNCNDQVLNRIKERYFCSSLYKQQFDGVRREAFLRDKGRRYHSWDYHMLFSVTSNSMYGISPCKNQIKNIGIDNVSEHGFHHVDKRTMNLCGMDSYPLSFPLHHPQTLIPDAEYDRALTKKIIAPASLRIKGFFVSVLKRIFQISEWDSLRRRK